MSPTVVLSEESAALAPPAPMEDLTYRALVAVSSPERQLECALFAGMDWEKLLRQARHHSLSPLLAHRLLESSVSVPPSTRARLKNDFQSNLRRNFALLEEALRIGRAFRRHQIDVIPYKGPVLAEQLWGSFTLRECSDLDVMVRRPDVDRAGSVLRTLGYSAASPIRESLRSAFIRNASEEQFRHAESNIFLELQWTPAPRAMAVDFNEESLWRNRIPITVTGESVQGPSPEDLFALLAIHGWKHNWSKLIWVADLVQVMRRYRLDWELLRRSAARDGWLRILLLAIAVVERVYGLPGGIELERLGLESDSHLVALVRRLEDGLREGSDHGYLQWHRDMLSARDNGFSQIRQLVNFFFTPGLADYQCTTLPRWGSKGYRLVRMARLARFGLQRGRE